MSQHSVGSKIALFMLVGMLILPAFGVTAATGGSAPSTNGKIVYISDSDGEWGNWDIYIMNADGTGQAKLTDSGAEDGSPCWSPNGTKIVFYSERDGHPQIYVMNPDGTGQTRLVSNAYNDWAPDWSPDGSRIAFASDRDGNPEIYVMNADGTGQTRLTANSYVDDNPSWSPDGTRIMWDSDRGIHWDIYVMNADGTGQTRLTNNVGIYDGEGSWSPDGTRIAFCSDRDGHYQIYVMNANGTGVTRLTNNAYDDGELAWSPDGAKIAFASTRDGNYEIYVMNADGTGQTRLTNTVRNEFSPAWQTLYLTQFQQAGIGTDFSGNVLTVDGMGYAAGALPASSAWETGTQHTFSWSSPLSVSAEKRYAWSSTTGPSTGQSGTFLAASGGGQMNATYTTQYYVTFWESQYGSVDRQSGWFDNSSTINVTATASSGYFFTGWQMAGALQQIGGAGNNMLVRVAGPGSVSPVFQLLDLVPPNITVISPTNGSSTTAQNLTVSASYSDNVAVDPMQVVLTVDGIVVTPNATVMVTGINYSALFAIGTHNIGLTVKDTSGNARTATWSFTVQEPPKSGCFIATATYGSEAAPQVQALRDFRDGIAMKTFAGSSFMTGFLTWYYSWSPPVAYSIAPNDGARSFMRVALQPLLSTLDIATLTFSTLSFNAEFAIVAAGFAAASLIGLIYIAPAMTLALVASMRLKKNLGLPNASRYLRYAAVPWLASLALIAIAELALAPTLMMTATAAFVALTVVLIAGTFSLWLASLSKRG